MSPLPTFSSVARRVRHLRLRAARAEEARRATIALSDALHTASLPDGDGSRLILIRRLDLGRIPAHASPRELARCIEQAMRQAAARAVAFDQPGAATATAVAFPDHAEALVELARRHARGERTDEDLWSHVVPGWRHLATRGARWRELIVQSQTLEGATIAVAAVIEQAALAGAIGEMLATISPAQAAAGLRAAGWQVDTATDSPAAAPLELSPRFARLLPAAGHRDADNHLALVWCAVTLAVAERPARAAQPDLPSRVAAWIRSRISSASPQANRASLENAPVEAVSRIDAPVTTSPRHLARKPDVRAPDRTRAAHLRTSRDGPSRPETTLNHVAPEEPARQADRAPEPRTFRDQSTDVSACAGLLFLVPVLQRLGLPAWLARRPEWLEAALPVHVLLHAARRAGFRDDDPLVRALIACRGDLDTAPGFPAWLPDAWLAGVRRWCRRRARTDWLTVVHRTGRVCATRTHLEITFARDQTDLAIRRAALDVDPGWVPWLGRVIRFHYLDADDFRR